MEQAVYAQIDCQFSFFLGGYQFTGLDWNVTIADCIILILVKSILLNQNLIKGGNAFLM